MEATRRGFLSGLIKAPLAVPALGLIKFPTDEPEVVSPQKGDLITIVCSGGRGEIFESRHFTLE